MKMLKPADFYRLLKDQYPHDPTEKQEIAMQLLAQFINSKKRDELFLLRGYAGTGKTTLVGTLVKNLWHTGMKSCLLAPTGRAAKVMSSYSNTQAHTIHKKIYFPKKSKGGAIEFVRAPNKHKNTVFIVDEASMIPDRAADSKLFADGSLLDDLLNFVREGHQCKLLLVGDTAQLPPVKLDLSPALDEQTLQERFNCEVVLVELDEVVRQSEESGILMNATRMRSHLQDEDYEEFKFTLGNYKDIIRLVDGYEIQEAIDSAYHKEGKEETVFIVRANKRANLYNEQIRSKILFLENRLAAGDFMMVVKNNYFWLKPTSEAGFIANGDILEILEIFEYKEIYGFNFARVQVKMVDYPKQRPFETVLLLDTIEAVTPSLSYEDANRLYQEVQKDYAHEKSKYRKFLAVKNNPYFNALQVKFSYAITCHKSQGGQWNTVFVEQPYAPNGVDKEYMRWLYTAVTRAREKLYLIGFKNDFFLD